MLSRHRAHLSVILDADTPAVLNAAPTYDHAALTHRVVTEALLNTPRA